MILCLDIGNTHIHGGLYQNDQLQFQFRYPSANPFTSDQIGIFLKTVLREHDVAPKSIQQAAICSVVPSLNYSVRSAFLKYFALDPFFLERDKVPHIQIAYKNPQEVGADRLANTVAALAKYPQQNLIVIDLGTATTFDAITTDAIYLGGVIIPGLYISMKALSQNTAKLSPVDIVRPNEIIGQTTVSNIQAGLYYSHLGAIHEIVQRMTKSAFHDKKPLVIGTGGFASLFEQENIFAAIVPELVLEGLYIAAK